MFGKYGLAVDIAEDDIEINLDGHGKRKRYYRRVGNDEIEKFIYGKEGNLVICPTEPVNVPDENVSEHLLIEIDKPLVIESNFSDTLYVKNPVEIGVFLVDKYDVERIDLFTKTKPKYTLYGPPESGIICKWWKSGIFEDKPSVEKFYEGIMRIDITNKYHEWVEITKMVFRAYDMKVFYNEYSYMHAYLNIINKIIGETTFDTKRPAHMDESYNIYEYKGIKKLERRFVMEWRFK